MLQRSRHEKMLEKMLRRIPKSGEASRIQRSSLHSSQITICDSGKIGNKRVESIPRNLAFSPSRRLVHLIARQHSILKKRDDYGTCNAFGESFSSAKGASFSRY